MPVVRGIVIELVGAAMVIALAACRLAPADVPPSSDSQALAAVSATPTPQQSNNIIWGRVPYCTCLAGSATPDSLIQNVNVTPFNIGRRIVPTDFTLQEAQPFADALSRDGRDGAALIQRVLYWTSGQPYLTQRVCLAVLEDETAKSAARSIARDDCRA